MKELKAIFNDKLKSLRTSLKQKSKINESKQLCLDIHSLVHSSSLGSSTFVVKSLYDYLLEDINENCLRDVFDKDYKSIIYYLWHSTRIEDITVNILVNDTKQVFYDHNYSNRLNTAFTSTGNSFSKEEIKELSKSINIDELLSYRLMVAKKTKECIQNLTSDGLKRRFDQSQLDRILTEKSVRDDENSIWLLDYWGKKDVAGILLMPVTRHHLVHLNSCFKIKDKWLKKSKIKSH